MNILLNKITALRYEEELIEESEARAALIRLSILELIEEDEGKDSPELVSKMRVQKLNGYKLYSFYVNGKIIQIRVAENENVAHVHASEIPEIKI